jgi:hypothetical protein
MLKTKSTKSDSSKVKQPASNNHVRRAGDIPMPYASGIGVKVSTTIKPAVTSIEVDSMNAGAEKKFTS